MMDELEVTSGSLADHNILFLLLSVNHARATGILTVRQGNLEKRVFFQGGDAVFAGSNHPDDRLGEMLLKAGKITVEQYDRSVEVLKETGKKQGAILVELGYLAPKELFWGVKYQVREIVLSLFQWESGDFEFQEGVTREDEVIKLKMSMASLVYEGVKRIDQWTRMRREMPALNTIVALNPDPFFLFQKIELDQDDQKVLALVDGKRTFQEIMDMSGMASFDSLKALYVLWTLKIVREGEIAPTGKDEGVDLGEMVREPEPEGDDLIKEINDLYANWNRISLYEILGVPMDASSGTIKGAYYRRARKFHPDRHHASADESVKEKLTVLFHAVNEAYRELSDPGFRMDYDRKLRSGKPVTPAPAAQASPAQQAEIAFRSGIEEFRKGNFWGAVDAFRTAARLDDKQAKYWSNLALALSKMPQREKEAEEAMLTAMELEPFKADHFVNLGMLYLKLGMRARAKTQFEAAITWDPDNKRALRGLKECSE